MLRKTISLFLAGILCLSLFTATAFAALTASPTASAVLINGREEAFDAYSINNNNYFKLRDLAYVLNGTPKQFEVTWDRTREAIVLTSGEPYTPDGSEMTGKGAGVKTPTPTSAKTYLDGREVAFTAYYIEGNNYFKLRDIGKALDFGVTWDDLNNRIIVDTSERYVDESVAGVFTFDESKALPNSRYVELFNLTADEKEVYEQIVEGIKNFEMRIVIKNLDVNAIDAALSSGAVLNILCNNHPEFFWFYRSFSHGSTSGGTYYVLPRYIIDGEYLSTQLDGNGVMVDPPQAEIDRARVWIANGEAAIRAALAELPLSSSMSPFEMELAVHDWLRDRVASEVTVHRESIYGALVERKATCNGFSQSFQYILRRLGIDCVVIFGSINVPHAWNAVKLDGEWYNVDVLQNTELDNYALFNRTDAYMATTHERQELNPAIVCNATAYDYYMRTGTHIASDSDFISKVPAIIENARASGKLGFEIEFAPSYAKASEFMSKMALIDPSYREGIHFTYTESRGLIFGEFT